MKNNQNKTGRARPARARICPCLWALPTRLAGRGRARAKGRRCWPPAAPKSFKGRHDQVCQMEEEEEEKKKKKKREKSSQCGRNMLKKIHIGTKHRVRCQGSDGQSNKTP